MNDQTIKLVMLANPTTGVVITDGEGCITETNPAFREIFGYQVEEISGLNLTSLISNQDKERERSGLWKRLQGDNNHLSVQKRCQTRAGGTIWVNLEITAVNDNSGNRNALLVLVTETTEHRRKKLLQRGQTNVVKQLYQNAPLEKICTTIVNSIEAVDKDMLCSILMLDDSTKTLHKLAAPSLPKFYNNAIDGMKIGAGVGSCGAAAFLKERVVVPDILNHPNWQKAKRLVEKSTLRSCWSQPIFSNDGQVLGTFAIYHTKPKKPSSFELRLITSASELAALAISHKQSQAKLVASESRLKQITENAQMWIWEVDKDGQYTYCSQACEPLLGYTAEEIVGKKHFYDLFHPDDRAELKQTSLDIIGKHQTFNEFPNRNQNRMDEEVWLSTSGGPLFDDKGNLTGYRGAAIDITERIKLRSERQRSAQLEILGTVAAGVAHEINNPTQGILNYATLIHQSPGISERVADFSERIIKESDRIASITKDLLHYAKDRSGDKVPTDLQELLKSSLTLIGTKVRRHGIIVETKFNGSIPRVVVQPQSIQQVVINLLDNAYDALREKELPLDDKVITVTLSNLDIKQIPHICLEVYDKGIGMPESVLKRAREAFFSTKPSTLGTGLGLSIVNEIITKHVGQLHIESVEGEHTKVRVVLPVDA